MKSTKSAWRVVAVVLCLAASSWAQAAEPSKLVATCYGAAGEVSGSLHVLDTGNGRWIVDCGAVLEKGVSDEGGGRGAPGESQRISIPLQTLPRGLEKVSAVFITHAHVDHIGRLPLLVERGFSGPIYMTEATATLAGPMLRVRVRMDRTSPRHWAWSKQAVTDADARHKPVYLHWRLCKFRRRIAADDLDEATCPFEELSERIKKQSAHARLVVCEDCVADEVDGVTRLARPVKYAVATPVAAGVRVTLLDAGHLPGSASVLFDVTLAGRRWRIAFSGDLGNSLSPLVKGPRPAPACDAVFVESTYGPAHRDASVRDQRAAFRQAVAETVRSGGVAWIPCFSLDRTQKILYELHLAQREKLLPKPIPIYCPSPTAREATALYVKHRRDGWLAPEVAADIAAFSPKKVEKTVPSPDELPRPCVIISTSDILGTAWMRRMLGRLLAEPSTRILLVSYQDPESPAGRLKRGVKSLEIDGKAVVVRAKVQSFQCFTGHGDARDIDAWLANVPPRATVVLVHGDKAELAARAEQLRQQGRQSVIVAKPDEPIDLQRVARP